MPIPGEHKTVQTRILEYAEAIGWTLVSREEAEWRRGFAPDALPTERAKNRSLFFDDLLDAKVREFNPRYAEAEGGLQGLGDGLGAAHYRISYLSLKSLLHQLRFIHWCCALQLVV